jgi:hypothetical protein
MYVFLEPLVEEMKKLWEEGVAMWDELRKGAIHTKSNDFCYHK